MLVGSTRSLLLGFVADCKGCRIIVSKNIQCAIILLKNSNTEETNERRSDILMTVCIVTQLEQTCHSFVSWHEAESGTRQTAGSVATTTCTLSQDRKRAWRRLDTRRVSRGLHQ